MVEPVPEGSSAGLRGRDLVGLGGLLVGAIVIGTLLGILLDAWVGTSPAFTIAGVFLGMVAGAGGFALRVRAAMR